MSQWKRMSLSNVDAQRWDACVQRHNSEVFSEWWYWIAVCPSWQAWVKGDYEEVLAFPIERKWMVIPLMRTPLYVKWLEGNAQQLRWLIQSNWALKKIHVPFELEGAHPRMFQLLRLDQQWGPSKELAKNLRKAEAEDFQFVASVEWLEYESFMQKHHPYPWPPKQRQRMRALFQAAITRGTGCIAGVQMNGIWAAMQFYIHSRDKAYLIQNAVSSTLRNREPMPFLLHSLLKQWQGQAPITSVNFMGSHNPGVARFNEKFGAQTTHYWEYQ